MIEFLSEEELCERLEQGEQQVHRLRSWNNGDVLYGVRSYSEGYNSHHGKTFKDEEDARDMFEGDALGTPFDKILFKAEVYDVRSEDGIDAEPGLKFGNLQSVTILGRKRKNDIPE